MAVTRIKNNQITDLTVNAAAKLQDYSITSGKIANNLTYGSDLTIAGNLTVQGNVTAIDTIDLVVEDPLILLAKDQTGAPSLDIGYIGVRGDDTNIAFVWDESADQFVAVFTDSEVTNTVITINSYASLQVLDLTAANLDITGNITFSGNIVGNVVVTGNVDADNFNATGAVTGVTGEFSGNVIAANLNANTNVTGVTISASGNLEGNNAVITNDVSTATVTATGNVLAGNVNSNAAVTGVTITASGNLEGNNAVITNDVSTTTVTASGNIIAANLNANTNVTGVTITASGNLEGNNAVITNDVSTATVTATGNVLAGNINSNAAVTGITISASGNLEGNNAVITNDVSTATVTASGNIIAANLNANTNVTGVTISASGNLEGNNAVITNDVSTTTVTASGNIIAANLNANSNVTATTVIASGNVDAGTAVNANLVAGTSVQIDSTGDIVLNPTGNINASGQRIFNVSDPELAFDAATKQYVDDAVSAGIHIHPPVDVETPTALPAATYANGGNTFTVNETIAGNTVVFTTAANLQVNDQLWFDNSFNGVVGNLAYFVVSTPNTSAAVLSTAYNGVPVSNITSGSGLTESVRVNSGIGANLTANTNGALTIDGYAVSAGNRVLVYNQVNQIQNGVYDVTDAGNVSAPWILTRSSDADTYEPDTSTGLDDGSYFYVKYGDTGAGESYVKTAPAGPFIFGVANIEFTQFSASQVYSANTQAGLVLNGTVFSAKVDNDTTAFDGGGNIKVKDGANLVTPNIGDATGNSLTLNGNGLLSATTVEASGNVLAGNVNSNAAVTGVTITASGNLEGNNAVITNDVGAATITASGNVLAGNVNSNAAVTGVTITASGNLEGNNAVITNDVSTATVTASGNIIAANLNANTNVTGVTISASGNLEGNNAVITNDVSTATVTASGNIIAANLNANTNVTGVTISASGNLEGNNAVITNDVDANNFIATGTVTTPNVTSTGGLSITTASNGNIDLDPNGTGNIILTDQTADRMLFTGPNKEVLTDANATFDGANLVITGSATVDNVIIDGDSITSNGSELVINEAGADVNFRVEGDTQPNLFIVDAGSDSVLIGTATATTQAALKIGTSDSMLVPVGNTLQRPSVGVTGMLRFNTTSDSLEYYDNDSWTSAGTTFTVIVADEFTGDGSTVQFTLSEDSTTAGTIVAINGVVQQPTTAYSVSGNVLTFTEAPISSDVIDARILTTTQTVIGIQNSSGNAVFEGSATEASFISQGNIIPSANITYNLGSSSLRWNDIYLGNSTIYLGNAQISANATAITLTDPTGNATVLGGTSASIAVSEITKVGSNGVGNIGSASSVFDTVFAKATSAQYADLAEMYESDSQYEPGTVLCFGGTKEVTLCSQADCTRVAGVVSTNPSYLMNSGQTGNNVVAVALQGRVPCRVTGTIRKGDLIVSTGDGRGRANNSAGVGTVIGKALADFDGADGVIEVVVGRV